MLQNVRVSDSWAYEEYYVLISVSLSIDARIQSSTLCGTIKWISVFRLSNSNKWRWWMCLTSCLQMDLLPGQTGLVQQSSVAGSVHCFVLFWLNFHNGWTTMTASQIVILLLNVVWYDTISVCLSICHTCRLTALQCSTRHIWSRTVLVGSFEWSMIVTSLHDLIAVMIAVSVPPSE